MQSPRSGAQRFATTRWSLVLQARNRHVPEETRLALSELCEAYWKPLYAFVRRRIGNPDEAQDLTQDFFAVFLEKEFLKDVQPEKGRFRSFLLAAMKHFLSNERDKQNALKRGGGLVIQSLDWKQGEDWYRREHADNLTPEKQFEREWAMTLLNRVLDRLKEEQHASGKSRLFDVLSQYLSISSQSIDHQSAANSLDMSVDAVRVATHRLRKRYRILLREEIAQTTASPEDIEDELRHLFIALQR